MKKQSLPGISIAIAVVDIQKASRLYQKLGFRETMTIDGQDGKLAVSILELGPSMLILGPVDDPHYYNHKRAEQIKKGPRGLGVVPLITVSDLAKVYEIVKKEGLEILLEPMDEYYGDRIFMFLDPDGYEWKIHQPIQKVRKKDIAENLESAGFKVK